MRAALLLLFAACGRIGFADARQAGDDAVDAAITDGSSTDAAPGKSYLIKLDNNGTTAVVAGANGRVAVAEGFQSATTIAGHAFTGHAMYTSSAVLWLDENGAPTTGSVLDSTSICSIRQLGNAPGGVIALGYTISGTNEPAYGPCAIATSRQDAFAISVAPDGTQALVGHAVSSAGNIQGWYATGYDDGALAFSGVYDTNGSLGTKSFSSTTSDEEPFYARIVGGEPAWLSIIASADENFAGPMDARGDELCVTGGFVGSITAFGTAMTSVGDVDQWVARVDATGNAKFVGHYGSTASESTTAQLSVVATADGGCTVASEAGGDLALAPGNGAVIVHYDATGTATAVRAAPGTLLTRLGDRVFAAEPNGTNIDLVELATNTTLATISGGDLVRFTAVPPNLLAVSFVAAPPTAFEGMFLATSGNALAVLGL